MASRTQQTAAVLTNQYLCSHAAHFSFLCRLVASFSPVRATDLRRETSFYLHAQEQGPVTGQSGVSTRDALPNIKLQDDRPRHAVLFGLSQDAAAADGMLLCMGFSEAEPSPPNYS